MGAARRQQRDEGLSPTALALLALLRHSGDTGGTYAMPPLGAQAWVEIVELARRHGVAPLLHRALQARGSIMDVPARSRVRLEEERQAIALNNLRNYGEFRRIAQALHDRNIRVMPLKGLHLAELVYRDIGLRPMNDLDILVPISQLGQVIATVYDLGYGFDANLSEAADAMRGTKYDIELTHRQTGRLFEVHWSLGDPPGRYAGLLDEIWRRAVPARVGDAGVLVMTPEFLLLHVCAHLACHHVFALRLRALCDVAEILRTHPTIDWTVVIVHAQRCGWVRGVAAALRLASDHLGVAIPPEARARLGVDAIEPAPLADAVEQVLTHIDVCGSGFEWQHAVTLKAFAGKRGTAEKLAHAWRRIFVPRAELAMCYGVRPESTGLSLYYAVRLKDLLRRYAASAWALRSDPSLAAAAARHARLERWIAVG